MKKELYKKYFENKKITMMGLGLLGRGLGDAIFLAPFVKELLITDKKTQEELKSSIEILKNKLSEVDFNKIKFVLGEHRVIDFKDRDFILKAAGVPLESEYIEEAKNNNVPIYMSAALLTKIIYENSLRVNKEENINNNDYISNIKVIGVTGTRGKSTATMMIANMLEIAGKRVHLGGNVRGVANLPLLDEIEDGGYLLMELDSWQLQGFGDLQISPQIAVFTSFLDDHLNYYKGDREAYFNDKANIFLNQKDADKLIISKDVEEKINLFCLEKNIKRNIMVGHTFLQNMNLIGYHNQVLAGLVNEVGIQLGLDYDDIVKGIGSFKAVEGRLEYMGTYKTQAPPQPSPQGREQNTSLEQFIEIYNDNNATTPDAVVVGVEALNQKYKCPVTLICGGADKGLDLSEMVKIITDKSKVDNLILLSGTGTEKLKEELNKISFSNYKEEEILGKCIEIAFSNVIKREGKNQNGVDVNNEKNIILLFSPGFASFSQYFKNEYEKNDEFVKCVQKYQ